MKNGILKKALQEYEDKVLSIEDIFKNIEIRAREEEKIEIRNKIVEFENPYPKDVFLWDNKDICEFNRGRFNQHCFEIVENVINELLEAIGEEENPKEVNKLRAGKNGNRA